jgi:hypothetical protein
MASTPASSLGKAWGHLYEDARSGSSLVAVSRAPYAARFTISISAAIRNAHFGLSGTRAPEVEVGIEQELSRKCPPSAHVAAEAGVPAATVSRERALVIRP